MKKNTQIGVYVWRLCPIHVWHELLISIMRESYGNDFLQILWSSNAQFSLRNFFNYSERRGFYKMRFPDQKIVWMPDYWTDEDWLLALDDILIAFWWFEDRDELLDKVTFIGWCDEDVDFFLKDWRKVDIINRFDWSTPKISATEVRDALIHNRSLDWLLHPEIHDEVRSLFQSKWEKFKKL
ncbi:MAG: hypothetical protein ACD_2C00141G0017 [uncultured bacterium (gcode 4)]|uniref:Uncharacterized protein n=1 Tax=uncultured bacterium (gcode 4) TaxID=1234023 RepID=K2H179_9BACT|nr:MAG: hypothetical protein ACD_2C00141G0017 [uncultured bacterium (gcode 4)]